MVDCCGKSIRYLDDKKRKNKLKKQGLWEEVQRRERLDEEQAAAGFDEEEKAGRVTSGSGGRHRGGGDGGGGGNNWGLLGRANGDEGTQLPQKEHIRCVVFFLLVGIIVPDSDSVVVAAVVTHNRTITLKITLSTTGCCMTRLGSLVQRCSTLSPGGGNPAALHAPLP